jgi:hypothetical protein
MRNDDLERFGALVTIGPAKLNSPDVPIDVRAGFQRGALDTNPNEGLTIWIACFHGSGYHRLQYFRRNHFSGIHRRLFHHRQRHLFFLIDSPGHRTIGVACSFVKNTVVCQSKHELTLTGWMKGVCVCRRVNSAAPSWSAVLAPLEHWPQSVNPMNAAVDR